MDRAGKFAVGGVTAATLFEMLKPNYAWAQQVPKDDKRIKTEYATVPSPQGNGSIKGYSAAGRLPESSRPSCRFTKTAASIRTSKTSRGVSATANFIAFAPDGLTSVGGYPGDDEKGAALFNQVDKPKMTEDFIAAANWLKARPESTGKLGVVGFCFGGGIANTLATRIPDLAAAVPFYGAVPPPEEVAKIKAAVLAHHGELDTRLAATWPDYDKALTAAKVPHEGYIYPKANHGFHNDTTPRYDEAAAKLAWQRTLDWFNKYLRTS